VSAAQTAPAGAHERLARMAVLVLALLRASQLVLWLWVPLVEGPGRSPSVVLAGYVLMVAWSVLLFTVGFRRDGIRPGWLAADVAVAVGCAVVVSRALPPGQATSAHNWILGPVCGTAVTVAVYASSRATAVAIALITAAWLAGAWPDMASSNSLTVFSQAGVIVVFAVVAWFASRALFRAADQADAATQMILRAQRREAAAEARDAERSRQYARLHDTVLHTLENIARGVWDVHGEQAQRNCERDAEYLRGLISGGADHVPTDLGAALAGMARDRSAPGELRVNQQFDALPASLPAHVADALTGATREALNNAAKHAGVSEVWLTASGDGRGGVSVAVVDRGAGFDPDAVHDGLGLTRSIQNRVTGAGGKVTVSSAPGEGTIVEMSWAP
jgi:signal transduction histidine kinase